jgi:polar amino acid transport system substrate-binding protein
MTIVSLIRNPLPRRLALVLTLALLTMPLLVGAQAASLDEIKQRGLIVATEDDFRPFEFVKDGQPTGFDNELIEDLKKYAPFEIKQQILPWTGILAGVSTGKYDAAITAAIITKERKQSLEFTSPIADATHFYVKRKDDKSITSIKDLNGKPAAHCWRGCLNSAPCSRKRAASSVKWWSTLPIPKPIRIWRSGASTMSSIP